MKPPVILLAFANDDKRTLRELDEEQKELRKIFNLIEKEGKCKIQVLPAANAADVIDKFQEFRGQIRIFHYGGHSNEDEIFLKVTKDIQGSLKAKNLAEFLSLQDNLELVFLNSCVSLPQAEDYYKTGVKTVIATNTAIGDAAACSFAKLFYKGLTKGESIRQAFVEAEATFPIKCERLYRSINSSKDTKRNTFPWQMYPKDQGKWRIPMTAKYLTRIPILDLDKEFRGRETELQDLTKMLKNTSKAVLVNGLGGIGKTVLATAYVQQYGNEYDHVAWISRGEDLIHSFAFNEYLADTLGLPRKENEKVEHRFRLILRKLQQLTGQNLLIVDNAPEKMAKRGIYEYLPGSPHWQVLLTSRLRLSGFDCLTLGNLRPDAARNLFRSYYHGDFTEDELEELLTEVSYHTLTVELLARLLTKLNNVMRVSELTEILKQKQLNNPELQEKIWARHSREERGIYLHLMKAFELTDLNESEIWLLKHLVVLPILEYSVKTLAEILNLNPFELNKTLNQLAKKGWIQLQQFDRTFSIHGLIQQVVGYQLKPSFADCETLVERLAKNIEKDEFTNTITEKQPWITCAEAVEHYFQGIKHVAVSELQNNLSQVYLDIGMYGLALEMQQKAIQIAEKLYHSAPLKLAPLYSNIGVIYLNLGKLESALDYSLKSLRIREVDEVSNQNKIDTSYNNVALIYQALREYDLAILYLEKAIRICEENGESNHPKVATAYDNMGQNYYELSNYLQAIDYYERALVIRKNTPVNPGDLAISYNNISLAYLEQEEFGKAKDLQLKSIKIREEGTLGNPHYLVTSYNNLAKIFYRQKRHRQALKFQKQALDLYASLPDTNPIYSGTYYFNLAKIYDALGKLKKAHRFFSKSLEIRLAVLPRQDPDLVNSYQHIIDVCRTLGKTEEAQEYQLQLDSIKSSR